MRTIHQRINQCRRAAGYTLLELASKIGVKEATMQRYESGAIKNIKYETIASLAEALHTSPAYLVGWERTDAPPFREETQPTPFRRLPILGEIACGEPRFAEQTHEGFVLAAGDMRADFVLIARGDSMIGARINDGDIIFIRRQSIVNNGEIAAVIIEEEATLKRIYYNKKEGRLSLLAENPRYEPIVFIGEEINSVRILGKAVFFQSTVQ